MRLRLEHLVTLPGVDRGRFGGLPYFFLKTPFSMSMNDGRLGTITDSGGGARGAGGGAGDESDRMRAAPFVSSDGRCDALSSIVATGGGG
jgi:hypothetical protein